MCTQGSEGEMKSLASQSTVPTLHFTALHYFTLHIIVEPHLPIHHQATIISTCVSTSTMNQTQPPHSIPCPLPILLPSSLPPQHTLNLHLALAAGCSTRCPAWPWLGLTACPRRLRVRPPRAVLGPGTEVVAASIRVGK